VICSCLLFDSSVWFLVALCHCLWIVWRARLMLLPLPMTNLYSYPDPLHSDFACLFLTLHATIIVYVALVLGREDLGSLIRKRG